MRVLRVTFVPVVRTPALDLHSTELPVAGERPDEEVLQTCVKLINNHGGMYVSESLFVFKQNIQSVEVIHVKA